MPFVKVPIVPNANQSFTCTLPIDNKNIILAFGITYNSVADYWAMSIRDVRTNTQLLDGVPLVTGEYPGANLLEQFEYMGIGSAVIAPTSSLAKDRPGVSNLGTEWALVWGDTLE